MIELKRANFKTVVDQAGVVLIQCWAPDCRVCARFDPIFAEVANGSDDHVFAKLDVSTAEGFGELFGIEYTPTIMLYRDGLLLLKKPGNFSQVALEDMLNQAASLDMELVRAGLEKSQTS